MAVIIAAMMVGVVWAIIGINKTRERPVPKLDVGAATVHVSIQPSSSRVTCFASIKNGDNFVWSDPSPQAPFFDSAGKEVGVQYERRQFNLYPFFEAQGRSDPLIASPEDYSSCKASVLSVD